MYPDQNAKRTRKIITGFVVVFAVVIIAVLVNTLSNKDRQTAATATNTTPSSGIMNGGAATSPTTATSGNAIYKDGTYTASESYATPGGDEDIGVTVTLQSNTITNVSLRQNANNHDSREYQSIFEASYKSYVVGKPLNSINISRVSGASLTTEGFTAALEQIKNQAQQST